MIDMWGKKIAIPELRHANLLVETHEFAAPGVIQRLRDAFGASHDIEEIPNRGRAAKGIPFRIFGSLSRWMLHAGSDQRGPPGSQLWMVMIPKASRA